MPFVVKIPEMFGDFARGHVVTEQIQLFDVMPTVLELAGITPNHTHFATSLVPQLRGDAGDKNRVVYSEGGYLYPTEIEAIHSGGEHAGEARKDPKNLYYPRYQEELEGCRNVSLLSPNYVGCHGSPRAVMARSMSHKLVYRPNGISELYDLEKDPRELVNIYNSDIGSDSSSPIGSITDSLMAGMRQWFLETSDSTDWQVKTGRSAPQMPHPAPPLIPSGVRAAGDKRPNFVFYFPDTVRAESCGGIYGNPVVKTPFLDALAKNGTAFTQVASPCEIGLYA